MTHIKCPCINYPLCACAGCIPLTPQQNGGFPTEHCSYVKHQSSQPDIYRMITDQNPERRSEQRARVKATLLELAQAHPMHHTMVDSDIFDEVIRQANEHCNAWVQRTEVAARIVNEAETQVAESMEAFRGTFFQEHRKPVTSFDWELQQALIHLQNAISVTDSRRGHLLQAAVSITKGVRESD